jgi:hypothetical protein
VLKPRDDQPQELKLKESIGIQIHTSDALDLSLQESYET